MESTYGNVSISAEDNQDLQIEILNNEKALQNIGGIIFVSLMLLAGISGNSIAMFVYLRKFKPSTHRTFIVTLEILDLVTCYVLMPIVVLALRYPIMRENIGSCKVLYFVLYFMAIGSSIILVTIAAERYRKICVPHGRQMSERMSKYICVLDLIIGMLLSWPVAVMYGNRTFKINVDRIVGTECELNEDFAETKYPAYFNIFLMLLFFTALIILSILYALIGKHIFHRRKILFIANQINLPENDSVTKTQTAQFLCSEPYKNDDKTKTGLAETIRGYKSENLEISLGENGQGTKSYESKSNCCELKDKHTTANNFAKKQNKTVEITRVLFTITAVYFCSYLPHLALRTAALLNKNLLPNLSFVGMFAYQTFRWTFFINNMANPIIYGFYDRKFRREVGKLWRSCLETCFKQNQRRTYHLT
ncbi:hypothetical protein ACJMK2_012992 [Sinanodonta woodiana]|uniref:G-protein coupled receptors family 1 profile domain-containing protein n=1 Tax=Sinanodonta woodiana TaxID=1069815 RepID=A0ABD3VB50_SINWO